MENSALMDLARKVQIRLDRLHGEELKLRRKFQEVECELMSHQKVISEVLDILSMIRSEITESEKNANQGL